MSISQGHLKALMTQKLLNSFQTYSRHYQVRSESMPQIMKSKINYSGSLSCPFESFSKNEGVIRKYVQMQEKEDTGQAELEL